MREEGKYLYGIIGTKEERNLGPIGMGGEDVETIAYRDLSAVISNAPLGKYVVSKENLLAHERVIEQAMREFTVLPVRFCTVAANAEEIRRLLERRYQELRHLLRDMDGRVELGVKAFWRNMELIFQELVDENEKLKRLKAEIAERPSRQTHAQRIAIGEMVQAALEAKKEREGEELLRALKKLSVDWRLNRTIGDKMLFNAAFLVDRAREKEFDDLMERLDLRYRARIKFAYVGPVPPYNFVNITLRPDE
ncbi:MAG: GvpL/GvpF family gas vesicle protein [Candidatus Rokubacteria bacterium]|nr:GvpL/GvpF family gas vesicle protein [Candidatus Rokubacteria bacterium]